MKFRNIYIMCITNLEILDNLVVKQKGSDSFEISGWINVCKAATEMREQIKYLSGEADEFIKSVPDIYRYEDEFILGYTQKNKLMQKREVLRDCMVDAINLYESFGFNAEERIGLDIKLPLCNDFFEFRKCIDELEYILYKCPFMRVKDENLKFDSLDVGSMWLTFLVVGIGTTVGSVLLNNIAAFLDKCLIVKSHKNNLKQQQLQLEGLEMEKEAKAIVLDGIKKIYDAEVNKIIGDLENDTKIELKDGEERSVVINSFDKANKLIDKGMQFIASTDSPEDIKVLFNPLKMKYIEISKKQELLVKKDDDCE